LNIGFSSNANQLIHDGNKREESASREEFKDMLV